MTNVLVITDLVDADLFHTDPACDHLLPLVELAERRGGLVVTDSAPLLEAAAELGLLVESANVAGQRWCRSCRSSSERRRQGPFLLARHGLAA